MRCTLRRAGVLLVIALAACDDTLDSPTLRSPFAVDDLSVSDLATPDLPLGIDDFVVEWGRARCAYDVRCGFRAAAEKTDCEAAIATYPPAWQPTEALAAGRISFDAARAQACIGALTTAGCRPIDRELGAACAPFVGLRTVGQSCRRDLECATGWCQGSSAPGCPGSCVAWLAHNAPCDPAAEATQPRCDPAVDYCTADTKICVPLAKLDAPCAIGTRCSTGLFCAAEPTDGGAVFATCRPPATVGDPCRDFGAGDSTCAGGLYCDASTTPPTCAARGGVGAPCTRFEACSDGLDCVGLDLGAPVPGVCGPFGDVGASCTPSAGASGCAHDLRCDDTSHTCVAAGALDDDCQALRVCREQFYCDATGHCRAALPLGSACVPPSSGAEDPCAGGVCDANTSTCILACLP